MTPPTLSAVALAGWPDADLAALVHRAEELAVDLGLSRRFAFRQARREIALQRQKCEAGQASPSRRKVA